ncbi:MAG: hypothetical protein Q9190_004899 [Brigantiaea leucoxantha]
MACNSTPRPPTSYPTPVGSSPPGPASTSTHSRSPYTTKTTGGKSPFPVGQRPGTPSGLVGTPGDFKGHAGTPGELKAGELKGPALLAELVGHTSTPGALTSLAMSRTGTNATNITNITRKSSTSPGNLNLNGGTNGLGLVGMGATPTLLSQEVETRDHAVDVDIGAGVGGDHEEERKRKLQRILAILGQNPGIVSREGVERCARSVGLECLWEGDVLSIAGRVLLVEVEFEAEGREEVKGVGLSFPGRGKGGGEWDGGRRVLERNLRGWGKSLSGFKNNLERLGAMDRLGGLCFEAVEGVKGSLEKVWGWEISKAREEMDVLCKGVGRPRMHPGERVGLALQYWVKRRLVRGRKRKAEEMMDVDGVEDQGKEEDEDVENTYSTMIECEPSSSELYPSIRVSNDWVSEAVEKIEDSDHFKTDGEKGVAASIDWQDPPPTLVISDPPAPEAMNIDSDPSLLQSQNQSPDIRFLAKFEPPVIVPLQTALNIYQSAGAPLAQESIQATTYESLLFPAARESSTATHVNGIDNHNSRPHPLTNVRTISHDHSNTHNGREVKYKYTLFTTAQSYARAIECVPFAHPRQIVEMLPTMRQWALVSSILGGCFETRLGKRQPSSLQNRVVSSHEDEESDEEEEERFGTTVDDDLASLLDLDPESENQGLQKKPLAVDVSLSLSAPERPRLTIVFTRRGQRAAVSFTVEENGGIGEVEVDLGSETEEEEAQVTEARREKVRKVLEIGEDVGVLVEWMSGG